jgi:hypothetical protein
VSIDRQLVVFERTQYQNRKTSIEVFQLSDSEFDMSSAAIKKICGDEYNRRDEAGRPEAHDS